MIVAGRPTGCRVRRGFVRRGAVESKRTAVAAAAADDAVLTAWSVSLDRPSSTSCTADSDAAAARARASRGTRGAIRGKEVCSCHRTPSVWSGQVVGATAWRGDRGGRGGDSHDDDGRVDGGCRENPPSLTAVGGSVLRFSGDTCLITKALFCSKTSGAQTNGAAHDSNEHSISLSGPPHRGAGLAFWLVPH